MEFFSKSFSFFEEEMMEFLSPEEERERERDRVSRVRGSRFDVFSFSTSFGNAATLSFSFPPVNQFLLPPFPFLSSRGRLTRLLLGFILSFSSSRLYFYCHNQFN